jgi:GNAT superfamily N-acetyltransferase
MTAPTRIRQAGIDDAQALAALSTQLGYPADPTAIAKRLRRISETHCGVVLVADAGAVVGFVQAVPQWYVTMDACVQVASLVVDRGTRGAGIGRSLLRAVEAWAQEHGFRELRVRSNVIRERAHRLYLRHGYVEKKRQAVFVKRL